MDGIPRQRRRRLLEQATVTGPWLAGAGTTIRRGMALAGCDGRGMGRVGAVLVEGDPPRVLALLVDRLPEHAGYLCVPVDAVTDVTEEAVTLSLASTAISELPPWRAPAESGGPQPKETTT